MNKIKLLFIIFFMSIFSFGQDFYQKQWQDIKKSTKAGSYKSVLPSVKNIRNRAIQDHNMPQLVQALLAEFQIVRDTQDDPQNDYASRFFAELKSLENKMAGSDLVLFQVLKNEFISQYFEENQWKIRSQTSVSSQDLAQIETWSILDFKQRLSKNFDDLKRNESDLRKIPLSKYAGIFENALDDNNINKKYDFQFFPTAADWNSVLYINFLSNSVIFTPNEIRENRAKILSEYDALIAQNSGNSKLYFQNLKLNFLCGKGCDQRLAELVSLYGSPVEGDYKVVIATDIVEQLKDTNKNKEALSWIQKVKNDYPKSEFLNLILNLENQIKQAELTVYFEPETQSGKPIHISIKGRNTDHFTLKIYEATDIGSLRDYIKNPYENRFSALKKTLVRTENYNLPNLNDYLTHQTSLEIQALPSGIYFVEYLVDSKDPKYFYFIVSESRIVAQVKGSKGGPDVQKLVSREDGAPLANRKIDIYDLDSKDIEKSTINTDVDGNFKIDKLLKDRRYRSFLVAAPGKNYQLLHLYGNQFLADDTTGEVKNSKAQIFLDRAIYRPGQTVYFKVINTSLSYGKEKVTVGLKQKITLLDANQKEISFQDFTTNDFGSYHGSFVLPNGKLNGIFLLKAESRGIEEYENFRVEEYKRPKFELTFEPVKEEYKYGQMIEIHGKAATFSGLPLANATVQYEVKKRDIRRMFFSWLSLGNTSENSILGEAKTNADGEFSIKLDLKKDPHKNGIQIDEYGINASLTDVNGETQSAGTVVRVASVSHYLEIRDEHEAFFADDDISLNIDAKNYSRQNLDKSFSLKLSRFQDDKRIFRNNFKSNIQDLPKLNKADFIAKFPHDYYDQTEFSKKTKTTVFDKPNVKNQAKLGNLVPGDYELEAYNIEGGDTIKVVKTFSVFDKNGLGAGQKPFLKLGYAKDSLQRGELSKIYVYSAVPNAKVRVFFQTGNGETKTETLQTKNGVAVYSFKAPENQEISELKFQFQIVAFNDVQTETAVVKIADSQDALRIETTTFRDKIEPGSREKWAVKVLGNGKEAVNAEVLANMYDMSLDKFASNRFSWHKLYQIPSLFHDYSENITLDNESYSVRRKWLPFKTVQIPELQWFHNNRMGEVIAYDAAPAPMMRSMAKVSSAAVLYDRSEVAGMEGQSRSEAENIPIRQNLNETAFFYPDLKTDKAGNVQFEFTSPEALTQWKLMFLAHTRDARAATLEKEVVTQKDFSVAPNYPRFLREGDEIVFQSKISSLADKLLSGNASLQILDAATNEDISRKFALAGAAQNFSVEAGGSAVASWKIIVPQGAPAVVFRVSARAGSFSDGEQKAVVVLPNRMLVTDAQPIFVKEGQTKTFTLNNLKNVDSKSIENFSNTLELSTNPVWEMIFALPALKEDPNSSADVVFNKWFADVLAAEIFKANPKLKTVFDEYRAKSLLNSNLDKNQELKQLLLEETPWVLESLGETEQMERISRLFDADTMQNSITTDWAELAALQNPDGGFSWYSGYPSSYSTSLYILKNLGKLNEWLKGNAADYQNSGQKEMLQKLVNYVDNEVNNFYSSTSLKESVWNNFVLDYLDSRHYWEKDFPLKAKGLELKNLLIKAAPTAKITDYTFYGLHRAALLFDDYKLTNLSKKLLTYIKETATQTETQGVYWKNNSSGWGWYSSAVLNQAGAIEAFQKLSPADKDFIEEMKIWLITQKEVGGWGNSRATAEVIFTMLNSGKTWMGTESDHAEILWGGRALAPKTAATGYVKESRKSDVIDKNLATVTVKKSGPGVAQGGIYWQYYEDMDKVKSGESYISITKELYRKVKTENGEQLQKISAETPLKVGDKVTVRMILNTDRDMQFVHIKDMRAAGFEPLDVLSGYRWKNNLGYYQSTRDASTNFYIEHFPKGRYVFEYDYICNAAGHFSSGITTLQNYYAPQMNAHSQGTKVLIAE